MSYDSRIDTHEHISKVRRYVGQFVSKLIARADIHDASKLVSPEVEMFDEFTPKLRELVYGSDEYGRALEAMGEALEHHYAVNPHHPEYHEHGVRDMTLVDIVEMLCDWKAASERPKTRPGFPAAPGRAEAPTAYPDSFLESIAINQKRWKFGDELRQILENTAVAMWGAGPPVEMEERHE